MEKTASQKMMLVNRLTRLFQNGAAAIGLINLIYNRPRYEHIVRLKLLPRAAA